MNKGRFYPDGKINTYHPDVRESAGSLADVAYAFGLLGIQSQRQIVAIELAKEKADDAKDS